MEFLIMTFPKIEHPTYTVDLSIGKVTYRPFLVKEQKILMMSHGSNDVDSMVQGIKVIANNCIISPQMSIEKLPLVDLTLLFINLQAKSKGEMLPIYFKCTNEFEGKPCGMIIDAEVNLMELKPTGGGLDSKIMLTKDIGVVMHYPSFDLLNLLVKAPTFETEYVVVAGCIDYVFDSNGVYRSDEASPHEVQKFVDDLPEDQYNKMKAFVDSAPTVKTEFKKQCLKCKYTHDIKLEGLSDFFV